jgi:hypothetical protein
VSLAQVGDFVIPSKNPAVTKSRQWLSQRNVGTKCTGHGRNLYSCLVSFMVYYIIDT